MQTKARPLWDMNARVKIRKCKIKLLKVNQKINNNKNAKCTFQFLKIGLFSMGFEFLPSLCYFM